VAAREAFVQEFQDHITEEDALRKALAPMASARARAAPFPLRAPLSCAQAFLHAPAHASRHALHPPAPQARGGLADSLARALLCVPCLQTPVAEVLLERLCDAANDDAASADLPAALLAQFRWLDHVSNADALTEKLLEVLDACPVALQKGACTHAHSRSLTQTNGET
jgi:hypothetical protein